MTVPRDASNRWDSPAVEAFFSLGLLWRSLMQSIPMSGALAGLHGPQLHLFFILSHGPERSMRELAELTGTSSANLTGIIDRLEERGLVERVRSQSDRRVVLIRLTALGKEAHDAVASVARDRVHEVSSTLTPEEQQELLRLTHKLADAAGIRRVAPEDVHVHPWRKEPSADA